MNDNTGAYWIVGIFATLLLVLAMMFGLPLYAVWHQGLSGQAQLAESEYSRRITIEEAKAVKESASLLAEAEVIRAHGVREANSIIADGLGGPEGYLRYLWIQTLDEENNKIIYVPTEAGIPILEAGRR